MAQLRDAQTSDLLAEGTPLEVVTIATEIGLAEVIFDDVGEGFDPGAVLEAHASAVESYDRAAETDAENPEQADRLRDAARDRRREAETARKKVAGVRRQLDDVRERRRRRREREQQG